MAVTRPRPGTQVISGIEVSGVSLVGTKPAFLDRLFAALKAVAATAVDFTSLKRDPGPGNDVSNSNHITGDAGDGFATIRGRRVPLGTAVKPVAGRFGLRSGDVAGFDPAKPGGYDPVHVDDGANVNGGRPLGRSRAAGGNVYGYAELQNLWNAAGGDSSKAELMAAIALAESSGDPNARNVNVNGSTDRGLWQVNSVNFDSDTLFDPQTNASWAVRIYKSQGPRAWTTYKTGAYRAYLAAGASTTPTDKPRQRPSSSGDGGGSGGGVLPWLNAIAGGPVTTAEQGFEALFGGGPLGSLVDVFKGLVWLMKPQSWLRAVEFVTGMFLLFFSAVGLAVMFLQKSGAVGKAANVASVLPGPAGVAGRAVTTVRRPAAAARQAQVKQRRNARLEDRRQRDELDLHYRANADELDERRRARKQLREQAEQERRDRIAARRRESEEVPF